ncbi:MAG: PKD domain-containing protein [Myxococcota bacterium]|nr:PKD domain-containing protein [Myxococcota bacterium]
MTPRFFALLCLLGLSSSGCGPGDPLPDGGQPPVDGGQEDGGPEANRPPVASFTAADSVTAGSPLVVDAAASHDPDGDPLRFSWRFGDGGRGGTSALAHLFTTAGSYQVELTVTDPAGLTASSTQTVTVTAGPAATAQVPAQVRVLGPGETPLPDVTVSVVGTDTTATTDAEGNATLQVGTGIPQTLRAEKPGYLRQTYLAQLAGTATFGHFLLALRPAPEPLTLPDAAAGGTLEAGSGARLILPPSALVDDTGARVSGAVEVRIAPVDVVTDARAFPGSWSGMGADGVVAPIVSFGATDFVFTQGGKRLDLAPDRTATVELPVFPKLGKDGQPLTAGTSIPLWSLDETSGVWVREGQGTLVAAAGSPSGFVQRAEVGHFSWWNCDDFTDTHQVNVDCCLDENGDGACDSQVACFVAGQTCATPDCNDGPEDPAPPQSGASTSVGASAPMPLRMPTGFSVRLHATGPQGLSSGAAVVASQSAGIVSALTVVLTPTEAPDPSQLITLPFDQTYPAGPLNEPVRFQFDATAGQKLWASVERSSGSPLTGTLRLLGPGDAPLQSASFHFASGTFVHEVSSAGRYTLELTPEGPAAGGGYRLQAKEVGTAMTVVAVSPTPGEVLATPPATVVVTLSAPVKANTATTTTVKLFGPGGEVTRAISGGLVVSGNTLTFTPKDPLGNGVPYRLRLTTGLLDTSNRPLVGTYESSFRTQDVVGGSAQLVPSTGSRTMAMARDGSALVIHANGLNLTFSRYLPGEGWSMPERLAPGLTDQAFFPMVTFAVGGQALATWLGSPNGNAPYTYYSALFDPASGWGPPVVIPIDPVDLIDVPSRTIALDGQGRALAAWKQYNNGAHGWYSRYLPGSGWGTAARFDSNIFYSDPGLVVLNEAGEGGMVFKSNYNQFLMRFDPVSGTLGAPVDQGNWQGNGRGLAVDDAGNLFTLRNDFVKFHPLEGVAVESQVTGAATTNCPPKLAVSPGGKAVLAYCLAGPTPHAETWIGGSFPTWAAPQQLNTAAGLTRLQVTTTGEDPLVLYGMPNSAVLPAFRRNVAGVWDPADTSAPGQPEVSETDNLAGSLQGTALWLGPLGKITRLQ